MKASPKIFMLATATLLLACADLLTGGTGLTGLDAGIFLKLRLPRMLTAVLAGACLSLAGLQMQSVFRNPLADPSILGISSGAGLGVALVMLLWGGGFAVGSLAIGGFVAVLVAAFIGAFTVTLIMYLLSLVIRSNTILLIVGRLRIFLIHCIAQLFGFTRWRSCLYDVGNGLLLGCSSYHVARLYNFHYLVSYCTYIACKTIESACSW